MGNTHSRIMVTGLLCFHPLSATWTDVVVKEQSSLKTLKTFNMTVEAHTVKHLMTAILKHVDGRVEFPEQWKGVPITRRLHNCQVAYGSWGPILEKVVPKKPRNEPFEPIKAIEKPYYVCLVTNFPNGKKDENIKNYVKTKKDARGIEEPGTFVVK